MRPAVRGEPQQPPREIDADTACPWMWTKTVIAAHVPTTPTTAANASATFLITEVQSPVVNTTRNLACPLIMRA
jgi:hypothetical protein